ncbi:hypothetical protein [Shimia biformata]|uniref:hypothetical protein n=1 Tax=Shimia biformata TaxID=1294299 RepID=UPI001950BBB7|nr:hypothetical protein [Shimia biformata]
MSKPRCASTSVRRFLSSRMVEGDIAVDVPDHDRNLHPHMSAFAIHNWMQAHGYDPAEYFTFTVTRNPISMLWSYFNYFQPDHRSRYNFSSDYDAGQRMDFVDWLRTGSLGLGKSWRETVPSFISESNLSPLNLETHVCDPSGRVCVDGIFMIEDRARLEQFLTRRCGLEGELASRNQSGAGAEIPAIPADAYAHVLRQFPLESALYDLRARAT